MFTTPHPPSRLNHSLTTAPGVTFRGPPPFSPAARRCCCGSNCNELQSEHSDSLSGFTVEPLSFLRTARVCLSSGIPVRQMTFSLGLSLTFAHTHSLSSSLLLCHTLLLPVLDFIPCYGTQPEQQEKTLILHDISLLSSIFFIFYVCFRIWVAALPPAHTQVSFILSQCNISLAWQDLIPCCQHNMYDYIHGGSLHQKK